ncbi:hypothetical protein D4R78_04375 [bacterium]|nr:MAG: hypothetical protein D4R78_04375 [bacterium]
MAEDTKTPQAAPTEQPKPIVEKQTNCLACNQPIKKLSRYYRNGKFYCNKRCWKKYLEKSKETEK